MKRDQLRSRLPSRRVMGFAVRKVREMKGPKMKTNRAAAKRFKRTASGGVKRNHAYHGHLFTAKSPKRKRNLRKATMLDSADKARVIKMLAGN